MKIYTQITLDMATGDVLSASSYDYDGPLGLAMGADVGIAAEGLEAPADTGGEGEAVTTEVETPETGGDLTGVETELGGEPPAEGEQPAEEAAAPEPTTPKEILPAQLSKDLRALREAHPEQAATLKSLQDSFYKARAFGQVYASPEEARADKAVIETLGGQEGITQMRSELASIERFDSMAAEGDPKVIDGLFDQFPDGAKRLVPHALERLAKLDSEAYRETMRGPLLQMLEGDQVISVIGSAIEELKAAATEPEYKELHYKNAQRELGRIAQWYNGLSKQEEEFKNRYRDPKLQEMQTRERQLRDQQTQLVQQQYTRDISSYVGDTVKAALAPHARSSKLGNDALNDLVLGVRQEMQKTLSAHTFYMQSVNALIAKGDHEGAVRFAKPYIDQARKNAVNAVWTRRYGATPAARKPAPVRTATGGNASGVRTSEQPIPIAQKPNADDIDWTKDPTRILFIGGKGYLKSGKFVQWRKPATVTQNRA